jgi:hypothetical protein
MIGRYHLNSRLRVLFMDRFFFSTCAYTELLVQVPQLNAEKFWMRNLNVDFKILTG